MKKIIIVLLIAAAGWFYYKGDPKNMTDPRNPEVIAKPLFAEVHMTTEGPTRSLELVAYAKMVDQADCQRFSKSITDKFLEVDAKLEWKLKSSECKTELAPRYAKLFDNQPTSLTYLALARSDRQEREIRVILWGLSVEESAIMCDWVPNIQTKHKGGGDLHTDCGVIGAGSPAVRSSGVPMRVVPYVTGVDRH